MKKFLRACYACVLAISSAVLLTSCAKEKTDNIEGGNGDYEKAYFSVYFSGSTSNGSTRAGEDPSELESGQAYEQQVDQVYILLYKTDGTLGYAFDIDASNVNGSGIDDFDGPDVSDEFSSTPSRFVSVAQLVDARPYSMVVIANPGEYAEDTKLFSDPADWNSTIYKDLTTLQAAVSGVTTEKLGGPDGSVNKFFMSNANGPVPISVSMLKSTAELAEKSPVAVKIDRALAKVVVKEKRGGATVTNGQDGTKRGEVTSFQWTINNVNTKMHLLRQYAMLCDDSGTPTTMETYDNSIIAHRGKLYATDPNFTSTAAAGDFTNDATLVSWNAAPTGNAVVGESIYKYSTENTMDVAAQQHADWKKYTTYVAVTAKIKYDGADFTGVNGYYSYNEGTALSPDWRVFTWAQAKAWWKNGTGSVGDYPYNMQKLHALLEDIVTNSENTVPFDFNAVAEPGTAANLFSTTSNGITYHPDGLNYYTIPIKHYNPAGATTASYGYYGVVRNNVYKITVNEIAGPGTTSAESGYLAADISINDWYVREQDENISPDRN